MLELILRLFLLIFVAKSVTSLQCYKTAEGACEFVTDRKKLAKCLSDKYEKFTCDEKDRACVYGHIIGDDGIEIELRGCISDKSAPEDVCEKELFVMVLGGFPVSKRKKNKCVACEEDNCNRQSSKHVSNAASYKNITYDSKHVSNVAVYKNVTYEVILVFFAFAIVLSF